MKRLISILSLTIIIIVTVVSICSCKKSTTPEQLDPRFNLDVVLTGARGSGSIKFRQDSDTSKIIKLETSLRNLKPNYEYKLQRAVDTNIDGNCTGTTWLTLGKGLQAQSILTDNSGNGTEQLWRSVASVTSGSVFDIHFQIMDAATLEIVLTSNCNQYTVR